MRNGKGIFIETLGACTYNNGDKYDGDWLNDQKANNGI